MTEIGEEKHEHYRHYDVGPEQTPLEIVKKDVEVLAQRLRDEHWQSPSFDEPSIRYFRRLIEGKIQRSIEEEERKSLVKEIYEKILVILLIEEEERINPNLTEELASGILDRLEEKFGAEEYEDLCPGLEWERVKKALTLENNPEAIRIIHLMEHDDHRPVIYSFDETGFNIGTSGSSPECTRNQKYDHAAELSANERDPERKEGIGAVEQAANMGLELLTGEQFCHIVYHSPTKSRNMPFWLRTDPSSRKEEKALIGRYNNNNTGEKVTTHLELADPSTLGAGGQMLWGGTFRVDFVD